MRKGQREKVGERNQEDRVRNCTQVEGVNQYAELMECIIGCTYSGTFVTLEVGNC